jgi:hypothetical protein
MRMCDWCGEPVPEKPAMSDRGRSDIELWGVDGGNEETIPFTVIGAGERASFADLPLTCPECGAGPLELLDSEPPGLTYIKHCGKSWLRGQPDFDRIFRR